VHPFPVPQEWKDNTTVSVLVRDKQTNDIVPATVYYNGVPLEDSIFTVRSSETVFISATSPGYSTVDFNYTVPKKSIKLYFTCLPSCPDEKPLVGDTVTITCKDEVTGETIDCALTKDGISTANTFVVSTPGNHTIQASKEGYESTSKTLMVEPPVEITYAPEELEIGKNQTITFSKETSYSIVYKESLDAVGETLVSDTGSEVTFKPEKPGYYYVYLRDTKVKTYQIKAGFTLPLEPIKNYWWIILIVLAIFAYFLLRKKKPRKVGYPPSESLEVMG